MIDTRNRQGFITTDLTDVKKIIKEYYKQLWDNNFGNLNEITKFLENYQN